MNEIKQKITLQSIVWAILPAWAPRLLPEGRKKAQVPLFALVLAVSSLLVYINTARNGYALDDATVITQNKFVTQGISAVPQIFATPYRLGFYVAPNDMYRPLSLVFFAAEYQLFDGNAAGFHIVNVLFFCGCVVMLFYFILNCLGAGKLGVAFIASLLLRCIPFILKLLPM